MEHTLKPTGHDSDALHPFPPTLVIPVGAVALCPCIPKSGFTVHTDVRHGDTTVRVLPILVHSVGCAVLCCTFSYGWLLLLLPWLSTCGSCSPDMAKQVQTEKVLMAFYGAAGPSASTISVHITRTRWELLTVSGSSGGDYS